jgi:hypothetical protein
MNNTYNAQRTDEKDRMKREKYTYVIFLKSILIFILYMERLQRFGVRKEKKPMKKKKNKVQQSSQ